MHIAFNSLRTVLDRLKGLLTSILCGKYSSPDTILLPLPKHSLTRLIFQQRRTGSIKERLPEDQKDTPEPRLCQVLLSRVRTTFFLTSRKLVRAVGQVHLSRNPQLRRSLCLTDS